MATIQLPREFSDMLRLLNERDARYLVIGGFAVAYHGYPRATGDIDIWVATSGDNPVQVHAAVRGLDGGINWRSFDDETGAVGLEVVLAQPLTLGGGDGFDVSPTGEYFAIVAWNDEEYNARMEIVVNWDLEFAEKMRAGQ